MHTRLLETNGVVRRSVASAAVETPASGTLRLRTTAISKSLRKVSSADAEMLQQSLFSSLGQKVEGCLRLDAVAPNVVRVRYTEGDDVPENATPMLIGLSASPAVCTGERVAGYFSDADPGTWPQAKTKEGVKDAVRMQTQALEVIVGLSPLSFALRDNTGRTLCRVGGPEKNGFNQWDAFNTGICRSLDDASPIAVESFDLSPGEAIYGFGEKFSRLDKVGQTLDLNMVDALGVTSLRSYKNVPFMVSTNGYGVFFNHSSRMSCWVGSMSTADIQWAAEDDFLDYFLIVGSIKEVLATYTDLTGKSRLPPKWSFGYWQSKISYGSAAETLEIGRKLREHRIPCDVIHLDTDWFERDWFCDLTFDPHGFPDPQEYLRQMEKMGYKISLWQLPYIPEGSKLFDDLKAVDGFVKTREGEIYDVKVCYVKGFQGRVGLVDYTNPNARRVHMDYVRQLFRMGGIRVFKTDFGEAAPVDGVYFDGTPGHRMHNLYPLLYNQAFFETTQEETGDAIVWARSAWAGGQRHPVHWGGDNTPNYANLAPQLAGGLSLGLSGFPFWSQDIGGFLGDTSADLLVRWMQLGVFLSHTRIHGFGDRELYKFPDHVLRICRDYLQLRYRLMPYIYGAARDCVARSLPMARAMVVDYQDDPTTYGLADQYMFGDSLLVAPILTESKRRRVYLPRGRWTDWWTLEPIDGGQWIEVEAQLEKLPLFVREGGVIPMGPAMNYVDEVETDRIKLRLSPFTMDGKSEFSVPIKDDWIPIHYLAEAGRHTLTIGRCETTFEVDTLGHSADIQHNLAQ